MRALTAEDGWPTLPQMEIVILSDGIQTTELVRPLIDFLTDNLVVSGDNAPGHSGRDVSYLHS